MNMRGFEPTLRHLLAVIAFATMLATTTVEISGQGKKQPPSSTTPGPQVSKTKLEVRQSSQIEQWGDSLTTISLGPVAFRFSTSQPGARTAQWQVSDKPFSTNPKATAAEAPHVIASGNLGAPPIPGQDKTVVINFAQFHFPEPLPQKPRGYWVFVVTKNAQNQTVGVPSLPVKIVHHLKLEIGKATASRDKTTKVWKLGLRVNYAPAHAEVVVQRLRNDSFPKVWWAETWVNGPSVRFLQPRKISPKANGVIIGVDLPSNIGAGLFQVRVRTRNPILVTDWAPFDITYPPPPPAEVVLKYVGLQSLEETSEVGADEILILSLSGNPKSGEIVKEPRTAEVLRQLAYHNDVDKGETHPADKMVYASETFYPHPAAAIAIVEIDDGNPVAYTRNNLAVFKGLPLDGKDHNKELLRSPVEHLRKALDEFISRQHGNEDDLVEVRRIPFWQEDIEQCKKNPNGVQKELVIDGDGGRFKLLFRLLLQPVRKK